MGAVVYMLKDCLLWKLPISASVACLVCEYFPSNAHPLILSSLPLALSPSLCISLFSHFRRYEDFSCTQIIAGHRHRFYCLVMEVRKYNHVPT